MPWPLASDFQTILQDPQDRFSRSVSAVLCHRARRPRPAAGLGRVFCRRLQRNRPGGQPLGDPHLFHGVAPEPWPLRANRRVPRQAAIELPGVVRISRGGNPLVAGRQTLPCSSTPDSSFPSRMAAIAASSTPRSFCWIRSEDRLKPGLRTRRRPSTHCAIRGIFELAPLGQFNKCNTLLQKMHTDAYRVFPAAICATPKSSSKRRHAFPGESPSVAKDEPDPREIHHHR